MKRRGFLKRTVPVIMGMALAPIILTHLGNSIGGDDTVLVGYKGIQTYDAGYFYCPYVPIMYTGVRPPVPDGVKVTPLPYNTRYGEIIYGSK